MTGRCSNCRASFRKPGMDRAKLRVGREPGQGCLGIEPWCYLLAPLPRDGVMCDRNHAWLCSNWGSSSDCRFVGGIQCGHVKRQRRESMDHSRSPQAPQWQLLAVTDAPKILLSADVTWSSPQPVQGTRESLYDRRGGWADKCTSL